MCEAFHRKIVFEYTSYRQVQTSLLSLNLDYLPGKIVTPSTIVTAISFFSVASYEQVSHLASELTSEM